MTKEVARIIGRTPCPLGDNPAAHVRQSAGKLPYVYCPSCGCTLPARNGNQAALLLAITRPDKLAETAPPPNGAHTPADRRPDDIVVKPPAPEPPKPARRASLWAPLLGASK